MSVAQAAPLERIESPLASNNPFRNRMGSNSVNPPSKSRPISTNPFLDTSEVTPESGSKSAADASSNATQNGVTDTTKRLADLNMKGRPQSPSRGPRPPTNGDRSRENVPPHQFGRFPPPNHRPSASEEDRRRQQGSKARTGLGELDIFADPPELNRVRETRRPRRNSESSVKDKPNGLLEPDDEKRRRDRKHRESKRSDKPKKPSRRLDVIDKLDVTSIYGTGLFHHDGPFDACNPHRNRKNSRQAPMQAFPKDSLNMKLGGSGPLKKNIDLEQYHGRGQEAHIDYNEAAVVEEDAEYFRRPQIDRSGHFNPTSRIEPVHGNETTGLGTSTFLEGAPASRAAIQRRESEFEAAQQANAQSLSRKKSIAQKIRSVRPNRMNSPEPALTPTSPLGTAKSESNTNPFFKEYDQDYDKKGAQIAFAEEQQKPGRARAPSSPRRGLGLERKTTHDSVGGEEGKSGGFLNRVKSLKGGRRIRPERRETSG